MSEISKVDIISQAIIDEFKKKDVDPVDQLASVVRTTLNLMHLRGVPCDAGTELLMSMIQIWMEESMLRLD